MEQGSSDARLRGKENTDTGYCKYSIDDVRPWDHAGLVGITNSPVSNWNRAIEVRAGVLRVEVETGIVFANIALSARDSLKRIRNTKNAKAAYAIVLRWIDRVHGSQVASIATSFESLNYKLIVLGEMDAKMLGRRLDDRIRKLSAIAEDFPGDSPMRQKMTDQIKAEISEYFEREKNPPYDADRRCHKGHAQNG